MKIQSFIRIFSSKSSKRKIEIQYLLKPISQMKIQSDGGIFSRIDLKFSQFKNEIHSNLQLTKFENFSINTF